jgi:hypothetical protein
MAELNGYVSTSVPIVFTSEGQKYVTVFMVNKVTPPAGVAISPNMSVGSARGGKVSNAFTASTPDKSVEVNVPAGMTILDAKGNPLEGKLDLTFVQADPTKIGAARSFPGGLTCEATTETGSKENTSFDLAGFFKIDISDESGRHGAFFSEGTMEVNTKIGRSVINPETGQPYNTGDKIGLWNLEEKTGQWNFVKNITVGLDPLKVTTNLKSNSVSLQGSQIAVWNKRLITTKLWLSFETIDLDIINVETAEFDIEVTGPTGLWVYSGHILCRVSAEVYCGNVTAGDYTVKFSYNGVLESAESPWVLPISPTVFASGGGVSDKFVLTRNPAVGRLFSLYGIVFCTNRNAELTIPDGTLLHFREKSTSKWTTVSVNSSGVYARMFIDKTYEVQTLDDGEWTPASPYEYTLGPASNPTAPFHRNLYLSIDCGK